MVASNNQPEIITIEQMRARYPSQWVLVGDPRTNELHEVLAGRVLWHSTNRSEIDSKDREFQPPVAAVIYLGGWPEGMECVL